METHIWLPKISMIFGMILIVVMSCDDFRKHVRKFISRWRYYFAGAVYVSFNLFAYLVLTYAVLQQSPARVIYQGVSIEGSVLDMLMPFFLAFVYFGAGAGSFRFGSKEIQLNKKLRDALEGMFNAKPLDPMDVSYSENEKIQIYKKLRSEAEKVEPMAKEKKWTPLLDQWEKFEEDETVFEEQIDYLIDIKAGLTQIRSTLAPEQEARKDLAKLTQDIQQQTRDLQQRLIIKVKKLLVAFAFKYYKDEAELKNYLIGIELLDTSGHPPSHSPSVVNRGLILGFMFGLLFGPLFGILQDKDVIFYCWRGSVALMLFTGCVSYGIHSRCWKKSVLIAGLGGFISHFIWRFIDPNNLEALIGGDYGWFLNPLTYSEPIVGLSYGITTALILYAIKFQVRLKVSNKYQLYAISTLSGAIAYPILNLLISKQDITSQTVIITAWIGAIAMASLSLAVNVAALADEPEKVAEDDDGAVICLGCNKNQQQAA